VRRTLVVVADLQTVRVIDGAELVATHLRSPGAWRPAQIRLRAPTPRTHRPAVQSTRGKACPVSVYLY